MCVRQVNGGAKLMNFSTRVPQKECGKRSSITFFRFRDAFGHFSVTFSDASVTFFVTFLPNSFCWSPFAAGQISVQATEPKSPRGGERKEPPEIIQRFRLRNWAISSADFAMTLMEGTDTILALFRRRIFGQYPAAPCSPGPFVLLLNKAH